MIIQQINTTLRTVAPGRIAEEIGEILVDTGHTSYIGYGRKLRPSASKLIKIGSGFDQSLHGITTRLFDMHGFGSRFATVRFVKKVSLINPDLIHLHNLHGYYLNIEVLFNYLKKIQKPVIWTLHDCWPFTGHCSYFDYVGCNKWKSECYSCPNRMAYPRSLVVDNSRVNFIKKKHLFSGLEKLTFVAPSAWMAGLLKQSFLSGYPVEIIHNGVDVNVFRPSRQREKLKRRYGVSGRNVILGVASIWDRRKGLSDFIKLSSMLSEDQVIILVGLKKSQIKDLPGNVIGIRRTESLNDLAELYSMADVFVNPTFVDNFPTTNIEALACGTPVITYRTGGSPEAVDDNTGLIVEKGDVKRLFESINKTLDVGKGVYEDFCRKRAVENFNKLSKNTEYIRLYESVLSN
ncbi:glycosyltransferase [Lentimicrobium saccharophilum]|uniref:Glycosyltransferase n=1 Tax=Lentimicrobium saccharophilum TaxID=1678841 RepID=A0A0S7BVG9_9BACT|nr:glycosyltransferase [Lentimicrobium saccharophilum]GAP44988.1 glycosyltransferase [Lentimicrobium saccharophilum]